ncbi:general secretion pathway protein GspK [Hyphomonas sp.]|uniref:general secretion pathway protein GspK n=1 Tax=Hyphomonas sp. TaxID=87 RepID=UPI00391B33E2
MIRRRSGARKAQDRGAALIFVVWAVGLMAVIGALIARDAHLDARESNLLRDSLNAGLLLDSGQRMALARLADATIPAQAAFPIHCEIDGARLLLNARPVTAFIDINAAPEETLAALFVALGARAPDAAGYAARIADYRDGDGSVRPGGAEFAEYRTAGLTYGPANRPFNRTGELSEIPGLPSVLLAAALPHLTAHSHTVQVDPFYASREVRAAIEGLGNAIGITLEDDAWDAAAEGRAAFTAIPVVVEVIVQMPSGYITGRAATLGPEERALPGLRRLIEERVAGPEPALAAGAVIPALRPCY